MKKKSRSDLFLFFNNRIREIESECKEAIAEGRGDLIGPLHRELVKIRGRIARMSRANLLTRTGA